MKNAHLRFGWLTYLKKTEKTTTTFKLPLDRFIGQVLPNPPREAHAHLISAVGSDTQISAVAAAIAAGDRFTIEGPGVKPISVCLERNAQCFRGSIMLPGRKRPLRHLIGVSDEFAAMGKAAGTGRTIVASSSSEFLWSFLANTHALPGVPDWHRWFHDQLRKRNLTVPLLGIGCDPILIKGKAEDFLGWIGEGVSEGELAFLGKNGSIEWPHVTLAHLFQQCQS